jgi:hypothetical protein
MTFHIRRPLEQPAELFQFLGRLEHPALGHHGGYGQRRQCDDSGRDKKADAGSDRDIRQHTGRSWNRPARQALT